MGVSEVVNGLGKGNSSLCWRKGGGVFGGISAPTIVLVSKGCKCMIYLPYLLCFPRFSFSAKAPSCRHRRKQDGGRASQFQRSDNVHRTQVTIAQNAAANTIAGIRLWSC